VQNVKHTQKSKSGVPIFRQLYVTLRNELTNGTFSKGEALPTEPELAQQYGISRVTVRRALDMLQQENFIERRRGAGTFVKDFESQLQSRISGVIENLISIGLDTTAELLTFDRRKPPGLVSRALLRPEAELMLLIERLRRHKGEVVSFTTVWVPGDHADRLNQSQLGAEPVVRVLEAEGLRAQSAEQSISAVAADERSSALLDVPAGNPVIVLTRIVQGVEAGPLLFQRSLYPPDRYEYHMTLSRDFSADQPRWRHIG